MALIKCPECGKDVSDKSKMCINCGFPIENTCVNEKSKNDEEVDEIFKKTQAKVKVIKYLMENRGLTIEVAKEYTDKYISEHQELVIQAQKPSPQSSPIRCPKCGSTAVTTGSRGFKLTTGFLGSNKTVNRCGKYVHKWKPVI